MLASCDPTKTATFTMLHHTEAREELSPHAPLDAPHHAPPQKVKAERQLPVAVVAVVVIVVAVAVAVAAAVVGAHVVGGAEDARQHRGVLGAEEEPHGLRQRRVQQREMEERLEAPPEWSKAAKSATFGGG